MRIATYRRNLPGNINILADGPLALFNRAVEIGLAHCVAAVGVLVDERDEAVFDLEVHLEAFFEGLFEIA